MSHDINLIVSSATAALRPLLQEAFDAGRAAGREEASNELRAKLSEVLGTPRPSVISESMPMTAAAPLAPGQSGAGRAAPGTVKPTIRRVISEHADGLTTEGITLLTHFKPNSVRGTLHTLMQDGDIERRGNKWFPSLSKNETAGDAPQQDAPAVSEQEPNAQGREAGPGGGR